MITVWLLRETRCLLYPKACKHWRWLKSAVQAGLEKCCGGENDTVKFGSESLTTMAALLFAFNYTHTYAHTRMRWRQLSKSVVCQGVKSHTLLSPSHFVWVSFHPEKKVVLWTTRVFAFEFEWTTYIHNFWQWPKWYSTQFWVTYCIHF